jgi:calcium-dependent protein kinase
MRALSPHERIINLLEVYEGDNNIYLILDLAEGGCLFDEIKARTSNFSRKEIQIIMSQLLKAISYMHFRNIMHRDLKPENILYKIKGDHSSLKIADFGLSTFIDDHPYLYPKCGTPGYVAPESIFF